jgi:uroporphyrinogen-III synthase
MVQENCPLKGRVIVVTRPREQAAETVKAIEALGGEAYSFPTIEITRSTDISIVKPFLEALANNNVDYVILMSVNGVHNLLDIIENLGVIDEFKKNLKNTVMMAVGPKTAQELEKNGIHVDLIPEKYTSDGIMQCLQQRHVKDKTIFIPRTSEAPPELTEQLRKMGNHVEEIYVYKSQLPCNRSLTEEFVKDLKNRRVHAILFTSALGVKNFFEILKQILSEKELKNLIKERTAIVAIGPTTAKSLIGFDIKVDVMPEKHTLDEALDALVNYWASTQVSF